MACMAFMGGSAPAMAAQVGDGYLLLTLASLKGLSPGELGLLRAELDKLLRTARAEVPPQDDAMAQQNRSRRIGRLNAALQMVQGQATGRR